MVAIDDNHCVNCQCDVDNFQRRGRRRACGGEDSDAHDDYHGVSLPYQLNIDKYHRIYRLYDLLLHSFAFLGPLGREASLIFHFLPCFSDVFADSEGWQAAYQNGYWHIRWQMRKVFEMLYARAVPTMDGG
jgi:hypothetical protein